MIHVEAAGVASTVQDRGRLSHVLDGVPTAGPADPIAFAAAQRLVGNTSDDAAIEVVGLPFTFRCETPRVIAVTGREVAVMVRDRMPSWTALFVRGGDRVRVTGTERTRYAYVAVSGGIASDVVLGSRAADPRAGIGHVLRAGEQFALGAPRRGAEHAGRRIGFSYEDRVAVVVGPHMEWFDAASYERMFASPFTMSAQSDRQGARLDGVAITPRRGELLSCGVVTGAIQVPRGGQPIVALADHGTTGGYPIIATVAAADVGRVAQRAPGESLLFYRVERDEARERWRELERTLLSA